MKKMALRETSGGFPPDSPMTTNWNRLQGTWLAGKYSLREWLGESDGAAFFRTTLGTERQPAGLKLIPETSSAAGEEQLKLWRIVARISHPSMLRLLDFGRTQEEGETFLYAVFEFPDDSLSSALDRGPLGAEETREVITAAVDALRFIHAEGLVHTAVDPSHVVAIGNQIKLSTDTLRLPSPDAATAEDVRSLGALTYQLLSGQRIEPGTTPDTTSIPEPFRNVIQHSLARDPNQRWSLEQISAAINPPRTPTVSPAERAATPPSRPFPKWIFVATPAFLILLILLFREIKPKPETPAPAPIAQSPVVPKPVPARNWRVIAYTYSRRAEAEKKARSINRKWSGAQAEVFEAIPTRPGTYLVALGGPMSHDEALRFVKTARSKGMPRATYVRANSP
jgi:eukaryotic-like serine/threonine-protein kinase